MNRPDDPVNILLVDDQPAKLLSLETVLASLRARILTAGSADQALEILLRHECAVLLVDVCMPRTDGFELAEMIRQHPRCDRTAIIFISAVHLSDQDLARGYGLGAVDYMPVPIVPEILRAKVSLFADLYRKGRELERVNAELQRQIAEVHRSHERLRFADRMATIGTLAAGLGHDMGNLLLPIRMRLEHLEGLPLPDEVRAEVAAVREASGYLQRLARNLRLLALDSESEPPAGAATPVAEWWADVEPLMRSALPRSVRLTVDLAPTPLHAGIGRAGLTQIVLNLVQNAGDALRGRDDGAIVVRASRRGDAVAFCISDNGPGMPPDVRRRCLEPFFTTKTRGLSTGLGLTLVDALIKQAGGRLQIESTPRSGTQISFSLPSAAPEAPDAAPPAPHSAAVSLSNPHTAAHARSILASLKVRVAESPADAAAVWITEADRPADLHRIDQFLADDPARRVIALCDAPPAEPRGRTTFIRRGGRITTLRAALADALLAAAPA